MKYIILALLALVVLSLFSGLFFIYRDRGDSTRAAKALSIRIGLSLTIFLLLMAGFRSVVERLAPIVALGYRHLIAGFPAPYDEESMTRFATEVRPRLEAMVRA